MATKSKDKYAEMSNSLLELPHINETQAEQWVSLQKTIDGSRDYLIRAVPQAKESIDDAEKILAQRTYTLIFFGGTGVGKSTLINALLRRNLLPTGAVTAVTGTIVYIEQAPADEAESLALTYWTEAEFAERVRRLCQLSEMPEFDITNSEERAQTEEAIQNLLEERQDLAKTEQDEYFEILLDCIASYQNHQSIYVDGVAAPKSLPLDSDDALIYLREDGFKGSDKRQIRLVRSATFKIHPQNGEADLMMNGYLRIVDVPGLGAGMKLHETITLEEMKREDAMIVLVTDAGRQRVDELKSMSAVHWIKDHRLRGLTGGELDEAAAKIFFVVNGGNVRQAFDRLNSGLPAAELEVKEVTRHISPNYWDRYRDRGANRPYFLVMAPSALYLQDPDNAPEEFAGETERIAKIFADQLGKIDTKDVLSPDAKQALLELSEVPLLREQLMTFIQNERVRGQLREASMRVRNGLHSLVFYYEQQLAARDVYPPFDTSWESLQERRYENVLVRHQKMLPRAFHDALLELSQRTNHDLRFRNLMRPTLDSVKRVVQETVQREVDTLLESYGTTHWDDRDVMYDNLVWGDAGIEAPIRRILFQVELVMQEAVSQYMPEVADVMAGELQRTLETHEIAHRLDRASYGQEYSYTLPTDPGATHDLNGAFDHLVERIGASFRETCRQATMYELMKPERSVHFKLNRVANAELVDNNQLLDAALQNEPGAAVLAGANHAAPQPLPAFDDDLDIKILDAPVAAVVDDIQIDLGGEEEMPRIDWEESYADKLDNIGEKTRRIFHNIIDDLFNDDDLLPRLRRLFWLEATKAERDFNNHIVKPMIRQHDRKLHDETLRAAMELDLESVSDLEELMRTWEGLHQLENSVAVI